MRNWSNPEAKRVQTMDCSDSLVEMKLFNETSLANHAGRELMLALIRVKQMGFLVMHMGCGSIIKPRRETR